MRLLIPHEPPAGEIKDKYRERPNEVNNPQIETIPFLLLRDDKRSEHQQTQQVYMQYIVKQRNPPINQKYTAYFIMHIFQRGKKKHNRPKRYQHII